MQLQKLWQGYHELYEAMSSDKPRIYGPQFTTEARKWLLLFIEPSSAPELANSGEFATGLYSAKHITPYSHMTCQHVGGILGDDKSLKEYSCSSLEKKNHEHSKDFFGCTMRGGGKMKQNAMETLILREVILNFLDNEDDTEAVVVRLTKDL